MLVPALDAGLMDQMGAHVDEYVQNLRYLLGLSQEI
jgi:hypothetical protein